MRPWPHLQGGTCAPAAAYRPPENFTPLRQLEKLQVHFSLRQICSCGFSIVIQQFAHAMQARLADRNRKSRRILRGSNIHCVQFRPLTLGTFLIIRRRSITQRPVIARCQIQAHCHGRRCLYALSHRQSHPRLRMSSSGIAIQAAPMP